MSIDRRMESGDEPMSGSDAGDDVEQRQPLVLHGGEAWVRSLSVVSAAPGAPPRLNHLDVDKKSLQRAGEIRGAFKLGLAPRNGEVVIQQHVAHAVDDNVRLTPAVRALESRDIVDLRIDVDVGREGPMPEVWSAGIVDHEIARRRRIRIV